MNHGRDREPRPRRATGVLSALVTAFLTATLLITTQAVAAEESIEKPAPDLFARANLVPWCIVPFDAKARTPRQRAEMLTRLGLKRFAYDWRDVHLPTFDDELACLKEQNIELTAVWFPAGLNANARFLLDKLAAHGIETQLWVTTTVEPGHDTEAGVKAAADVIRPIAVEAAKIGCSVGLYNHGGWFGEPENQVAVVERLKAEGVANVGIVYNLHHGHEHVDRFAAALTEMKPHLLALNLNGMEKNGDKTGRKIMPIGQGDLDLRLLRIIAASGYAGPIGILNHTDEDAEARLLDNLDGLEWLQPQLTGEAAGPKPQPRTWKPTPNPAPR